MATSTNQAEHLEPDEPAAAHRRRIAGFVGRHSEWLSRYLRWLGWHPADAEDLLQDVFVAVMRARVEPRGEAQVRTYLRETARRLSLAKSRRRRVVHHLSAAEEGVLFAEFESQRDSRLDALRACLEELPARQQEALRGVYADGGSRAAVAARLGLAVGGVKTLLERTKRRLRACIERRLLAEEGP